MSKYTKQEQDFILRTKIIISQYETLFNSADANQNEKYEVTLLLNSCVGLLILPQQSLFEGLPQENLNDEWGISESHIEIIKEGEKKTVANIARHLRNSLAHYLFDANKVENGEIVAITFEDYNRNKNLTFKAIIPINCLRDFVYKLSNTFWDKMKNV